jgi:hypothetical protein
MFLNQKTALVFTYVIAICLVLLSVNNAFFWDTVQLGSRHATYFYNTNFSLFLLPNNMDSGHIPAFGYYLALLWKIFGRTLIVSHLALLPFVIGIVYQLNKLVTYFFKDKYQGIVLLMVFLEACLLSQITLVSPDVVLVFLFLMAFNAILKNTKLVLSIAIIGLFLISMRGMMVALALLFIDIYVNIKCNPLFKNMFKDLLSRSFIYLPALLVFVIFSLYHFNLVGWIGFHSNSPWKNSFEAVDFKGVLYNIGIVGWRFLDSGKVIVWIIFALLLFKYKKQLFISKKVKILAISFVIIASVLALNMIWAKGLLQHRYLLPVYLLFSVFVAKLLFSKLTPTSFKKVGTISWLVVMLTGNVWVYPQHISKGWDSTLAHLPYYNLRQESIRFLKDEKIRVEEVSTFFPNNMSFDLIDLNSNKALFTSFENQKEYVLFSNVFNLIDVDYKLLTTNYTCIKKFNSPTSYIYIYKKNPE